MRDNDRDNAGAAPELHAGVGERKLPPPCGDMVRVRGCEPFVNARHETEVVQGEHAPAEPSERKRGALEVPIGQVPGTVIEQRSPEVDFMPRTSVDRIEAFASFPGERHHAFPGI